MPMRTIPKWFLSDGTPQDTGEQLAAGTYYAEIPLGRAHAFAASLVYDAALIATATLEAADTPPAVGSAYAAVGTSGWGTRTGLGSLTINAAAGSQAFEVADAESARYRVKLVVATAGICTPYVTVKGN